MEFGSELCVRRKQESSLGDYWEFLNKLKRQKFPNISLLIQNVKISYISILFIA